MKQTDYPDNLKIILPEPYLSVIGKVCVQWSMLESIMDMVLHKLAGFDDLDSRSRIMTTHMAWPLKMDILASFVEDYRSEYPHFARFPEIRAALKRAQTGRNKIIHAFWSFQDGEVRILRATARGRLKTSIDPITVDEINAIVDEIGAAAAALFKFILNK